MSDKGMKDVASAYEDFDAGRTDYLSMVDRVTTGYAHGLVGRHVKEVSDLAKEFADSHRDQIMWFTPGLIGALRRADIETVVITGSPVIAVRPLTEPLGIDRVIGLRPYAVGGKLSSFLPQNTARPEVKRQIVESFGSDVVLAAGDSVSDHPLLAAARVRLFVGDGPTPALGGIVRIPRLASPQARETLANAVAEATRPQTSQTLNA
jgi:phosphoserine phosphatase